MKWCPIRQIEVAKTFEECDEVNECVVFKEGVRNLRISPTRLTKMTQKAALKSCYDSIRHPFTFSLGGLKKLRLPQIRRA
jgi:hypothetical protein